MKTSRMTCISWQCATACTPL